MISGEPLDRAPLRVGSLVFDTLAVGDSDAPLVLFLHGFPQFAESWVDIMVPIANAGFRAVAVDQRGYSSGARPEGVAAYHMSLLVGDILGFAETLGAQRFHLVAHDWGGILAWRLAAERPEKLLSLTVLSTPHTDALLNSIARDPAQTAMSQYIHFFRQPDGVAEAGMLANGAERLRAAFRGKLSTQRLEAHVARLSAPGALTAALNWYRALDFDARIGPVNVDTLFIWGAADHALGEIAANDTADFVRAPYRFVRLDECSHWLMDEVPEDIVDLLLERLPTGAKR